MGIYGNVVKYMEIYGNIWKYMEIDIWKYGEIHRNSSSIDMYIDHHQTILQGLTGLVASTINQPS